MYFFMFLIVNAGLNEQGGDIHGKQVNNKGISAAVL